MAASSQTISNYSYNVSFKHLIKIDNLHEPDPVKNTLNSALNIATEKSCWTWLKVAAMSRVK